MQSSTRLNPASSHSSSRPSSRVSKQRYRTPSPRCLSSRQNSITPTEAEIKDRWRQVGKYIIMVKSVASEFEKLEVTRRELEEQQNKIKHFLENKFEAKRLFDPTIYERPKDGIYFSRALEEVSKNRNKRTKEQVRSIRLTLRDCISFAAYPYYVQNELSRVGILERYSRGRILIREGHHPARVYFILSGEKCSTCRKNWPLYQGRAHT